MKSISIIVLCLCVALCYGQKAVPKPQTQNTPAKPGDKPETATGYTTKYDNINLDEILASKRLVKAYISCLLTGKGCSPEGNELRTALPDALRTSCAKCTPKQKEGAIKVITTLQRDYPEDYKKLASKWDPTGEYFKKITATGSS